MSIWQSLVNFEQPMRLKDFSVLFVIEIPTYHYILEIKLLHTYIYGGEGVKNRKKLPTS
jgi:hypothetical protein